ncbi:MAG TPA: prolipoprotein diacylglyceryl transferase [Bacteroidales bacterium]|nr:prolipoprotein diacylglyceryl transferase [Bacteroidales bacterium]
MILQFITWNVNPEILPVGPLSIRWYGLLFAASFLFGYLILQKVFKREGVSQEVLDRLTVYMAIGTIVGARLGHVIFYDPVYYFSNPIRILKIWEGGLASHGAAIGILIALYLFAKKSKKSFLWTMDRIVIVVALAGFFIRTGNLMNSEIYGVETHLPWGFIFVRRGEMVPKHPTQIYEALSYLAIFFLLYWLYRRRTDKIKEGYLFSIFLVLVFTARFLIEFIKEVQSPWEANLPLDMGQILSIPFVIAGIILFFNARKRDVPVIPAEILQKEKNPKPAGKGSSNKKKKK